MAVLDAALVVAYASPMSSSSSGTLEVVVDTEWLSRRLDGSWLRMRIRLGRADEREAPPLHDTLSCSVAVASWRWGDSGVARALADVMDLRFFSLSGCTESELVGKLTADCMVLADCMLAVAANSCSRKAGTESELAWIATEVVWFDFGEV